MLKNNMHLKQHWGDVGKRLGNVRGMPNNIEKNRKDVRFLLVLELESRNIVQF
jgi:hypothetical protein